MDETDKNPILIRVILLVLCLSCVWSIRAEQLPIKTYTAADGLPRDRVYKIVRDPSGFLWFCTNDGLSRFDGYEFTNYGIQHGLPHRIVNHLLITRAGDYWVATDNGIARFNPLATTPDSKFQAYESSGRNGAELVGDLYEDSDGTIWATTTNGLHRLREASGKWQLEYVSLGEKPDERLQINAVVEDTPGVMWIGAGDRLYRRFRDGTVQSFTTEHGLPPSGVRVAYKETDGTVWLGTASGLVQLARNAGPNKSIFARVYTSKDGLQGESVYSILRTSTGQLWVASSRGLSELSPHQLPDGRYFHNYSREHGLSDSGIQALAEDQDGNLWLGTESGGAMKLTRHGFTSYSEADGLESSRIAAMGEDRNGEFYAITGSLKAPSYYLNRRTPNGFQKIRLNLPEGVKPTWGWNQIVMQDRQGEWWVPTANGLYRYPASNSLQDLASARPAKVYTTQDGLSGNEPFRLYEDWLGNIWIGIITLPADSFLNRWERETGIIHRYSSNVLSSLAGHSPTAFREDHNGNLWIGFYTGGLVSVRNGRFEVFTKEHGVPAGMIRDLYVDKAGRLWIASSDGGVARVDNPGRDQPSFKIYSKQHGLSSDLITCITEDEAGRIYLGTGIGVDRLDPSTGHVKRYTTADGLANSYVNVAYRDRAGVLWFGTMQGLSRLSPAAERPSQPPPVLIQAVRAAGNALPVSELGVKEAGLFEFEAARNQLEIKFLSVGFKSGEVLRYQFMLEGADRDWGAPVNQRTVTYANLKPGSYRFLVRAVNAEGMFSAEPATVTFTIIPPVWQRWWFIGLVIVLLAAITHLIYRYHARRLIELERVRTRIATDLHDDIGASLSKIAILSDVAVQEAAESPATGSLGQIADTSRDALDSMSDIVWAVNPQRDHLSDLVHRMRRFAEDLLDARNIDFTFHAPLDDEDVPLGAELRREVYLIFKECVNNLVKHSGCTRAEIDFRIDGQWLVFSIGDDGSGFKPADLSTNGKMGGHGLASIERRAKALGGSLSIESEENKGTRVTLKVPIRKRSWLNYPNGQ